MPASAMPVVEIPADAIQRVHDALAAWDGTAGRVIKAALRTGRNAMRTRMIRIVARELGLDRKVVRERIWGSRVHEEGEFYSVRSRAGAYGWPLDRFPHSQTPRGVNVDLPGGSVTYPHAFTATMPTGHEGIFERKRADRLPIKSLRTDAATAAIVRAAGEPEVQEAGQTAAMNALERRLDQELGALR